MRRGFIVLLVITCFLSLFLVCYAPALFLDRQLAYRDAGHYYYPLNQRVQEEWNQGRWPLWEPEENAGVPLLGNPTAAVLYPGKVVFAVLPYAWAARVYIVVHSALAFLTMLILMRSWGTSWIGSALSALAYAFGAPILFQYCNIIYLIGAAWLPLGVHAVDRWVRLGRRWGLWELTIVLSMQVLGGDPQAAYLLGLMSIGYALGLAWNRAKISREPAAATKPGGWGTLAWLAVGIVGVVVWCVATVALAQRLPRLRAPGKPVPPFWWMLSAPLGVTITWLAVAFGVFAYWLIRGWWLKRGWRFPLGLTWFGLGGAAVLAAAVTAVQLLPVVEFTRLTSRAADGGPHEIYPFSIEPFRLLELVWPNILGTQFEGNKAWGELLQLPGMYPKVWVPSLYLGGLTVVLALSSLTIRRGPPWRVWFTVVALVSFVASLGEYTSPIWMARVVAGIPRMEQFRGMVADLGPVDPYDVTPVRLDGYLRDGDGGFYWLVTNVLPGFRQFRYPAKLFTLTALGLTALAGLGWDRLCGQRARGAKWLFLVLFVLTLATLACVVMKHQSILVSFKTIRPSITFGPFQPIPAYEDIIRSLVQSAIVFGAGFVLTVVAKRRPWLSGAAALILMTADLACANARYVITAPQSLFDSKPEILAKIEAAERQQPSNGPYRIHRMPAWYPMGWRESLSKDRLFELITWERDTIQPKYGINFGVEYTHTLGVAELYDYEWYFAAGFPWKIHDVAFARRLGVEPEKEVVYFPRRAYDMWNTRYFITPDFPMGWRDESRGWAAFSFNVDVVYPEPDLFRGQGGDDKHKNWIETSDYQIMRNESQFPRSWVVHDARFTVPVTGLSRETRSQYMQEILYAADRIWIDSTHYAYDPHKIVWIANDDLTELQPYLSGRPPRPSENVKVTYPDPQHAVLDVNLEAAGIVVLADVYYPGWELTIDGKPAPIYRVNGFMRGAAVPAKAHQLVFTYAPRSFRIGKVVSIAGLALFVFLGLLCAFWPIDPVLGTGGLAADRQPNGVSPP
jgi:Bacterial membrane protein YfhO